MPESSETPRVFVSYARSDGMDFARELRSELEAEGFSLWHDLPSMTPGDDWWEQITRAIDGAEYMVMVMTEASRESPVCGREWRYARQVGTCVVPVKADTKLDFAAMPSWMRSADFVDLTVPERKKRFFALLRGPCRAARVPQMAKRPLADFVMRSDAFAALKTQLLEGGEPVAITAALRGAGGFGKTTLAEALCHDDDVQEAFHHGILWITLGQTPGDITGRIVDLIETLSGDRPGYTSEEAAAQKLAEILADRRCLIVIDDVWNTRDAHPFLRGGPQCARLLTTRYADTLLDDCVEVRLDQMRSDEAQTLLCAGLPAGCTDELAALHERLGEWPLLIKLVNGFLRQRTRKGETLEGAIASAVERLDAKGLAAFDPKNAVERNAAVGSCLAVSFDLLDEEERERLRELAVFVEDATVPIATVARLWRQTAGLDRLDVDELCERLDELSLLLDHNLASRTIRLHDVIRAHLRAELGDSRLRELDATLVKAWRAACPGGLAAGPETAEAEDYFWSCLPTHLWGAGHADDLRSLLTDFHWLRGKLAHSSAAALVADFALAGDDEHARLISQALRLSSHVLARDAGGMAGQILGRLDEARFAELRHQAWACVPRPALLPTWPTLTPPGGPLLRTFEGHTDWVTAVAVLADGRRLLSGSDDKTLKLWDLESGARLRTLEGHTNSVTAVAVLADGRRALSGSWDTTLKLWDVESGACLRTLEGHYLPVNALAVLADGRRALSGSSDKTLKLWDLESGACLRTLEGHYLPVNALAVLADGRRALSGSEDTTLKLWDLESGACLRKLEGHTDRVTALVVLACGRRALSGSEDTTLKLWDLESGACLRKLEGHTDRVTALAVLACGRRALSGSEDGTLKLWDLESGACLRTLEGHTGWVDAVAVLADGRRALSGSEDKTLKLWDLESSDCLRTLEGHTEWVSAVAVLACGRRALSGSEDKTLKLWDLESGDCLRTLEGHTDWVTAVAVLADGRRLLSGSEDKTLKFWDLESGMCLQTLDGHTSYISGVAVLADAGRALSGSGDKTLKLWDVESGDCLRTLEGHMDRVSAVAMLADGRRALSGSEDKTLKLWNLERGACLQTLEGHTEPVSALAMLADDRRALSGSLDNSLKLWDLESGACLQTLEGHTEPVSAVATLADGRRALSGSWDKTLKLWDLESGLCLATYYADAPVASVDGISPKRFVIGDATGAVTVLELVEE